MDDKVQEAELKAQSQARLVAQALGKAKATKTEATSKAEEAKRASEAKATARKETEQVIAIAERAIRAVIFPIDSNIAAEEASQRAMRESEGTDRATAVNWTKVAEAKRMKKAAQEAKRVAKEAKLLAKAAKKAKAAEAKATREALQEEKRAVKESKLAAKAAKRAEIPEGKAINRDEIIARQERARIANLDQELEQDEVESAKEITLASIETIEKEAIKTKEESRRETEEAVEFKLNAEVTAKAREAKALNAQLYKGTINLLLIPPVDIPQIKNLEEKLHLIQNLRVILTSWSVDEFIRIVVSAEQPIPLLDVLNQIPIVDQVTKKGKEIHVFLNA